MATLDRRIASLEATAAPGLRPSLVVIRPLVSPGAVSEVRFAACQGGRWSRADRESEDEFLERVCTDVRSEANGKPRRVVATVYCTDDKPVEV